jgi:hypothetical protein
MSHRLLGTGIALLTVVGAGCHSAPKKGPLPACDTTQAPATQPPIRVQLPQTEITIVQPEGDACPTVVPPVQVGAPESAPKPPPKPPGAPESAPRRRPPPESAPEEEGAEEGVLSTLGAINTLGQIAGFSRTTAMTRQLGTVDPGSAGLGIGFRWIHIPFPWFRLFSVEEQPSITVPLTEANLVAQGGGVGVGAHNIVRGGGAGGVSREELAEIIAQEVARRNRTKSPRPAPPADDAERQLLEKKLAAAEEQMERMAQALKALNDKLSQEPGKGPPK